MEMIDVLKKLQEIAETKPELVKDAVESVEKTNPKEVKENAVESEAPVNKEPVKEYEDKIQEYQVGSFKDFLTSKGIDIYNLKQQDYSKYAQEYKLAKDQSADAEFAKRGTADQKTYTPSTKDEPAKVEGGMSDIHIGAQEVVCEFINDDGNLTMRKAEVLGAMDKAKATAERAAVPIPRFKVSILGLATTNIPRNPMKTAVTFILVIFSPNISEEKIIIQIGIVNSSANT